jgi:hypothetical protein
MRHAESGIDIDATLGRLSFEQTAIDNSEIHDIDGLRVRLPRVEDLLIMKAVARRLKDLLDIEGLLAALRPKYRYEVLGSRYRERCTHLPRPASRPNCGCSMPFRMARAREARGAIKSKVTIVRS